VTLSELAVRIHDLRQRQEQLQTKKIEIENQMSDRKIELTDLENISSYVDNLHDLLNEGSLTEKGTFIRNFIKDVRSTDTLILLFLGRNIK